VLFDTSVVVAGLRLRASRTGIRYSADGLARWKRGQVHGVVGPPLLDEYDDALRRQGPDVPDEARERLRATIDDRTVTEHFAVEPPPHVRVSKDPGDDHLFALVRASDPDFLCTNDVEGLLELHVYRDTVIVAPAVLHGYAVVEELVEGAVAADAARSSGGALS